MIKRERMKKLLAVLLICLLAGILGQTVYVISFNSREHTAAGADPQQASYMDIHNREDATSHWMKRDYVLDGKKVNLQARTIDGTFVNHSANRISTWVMTIRIRSECFINQAWCGKMEIHQSVGAEQEKVQTLDLRNYRLDEVSLEYRYDGDLLIPLHPGDLVIYYPSEVDRELEIAPWSEGTMGMIFYYLDELDLTDYTIQYRCYRSFAEGGSFFVLVGLTALILILAAGQLVSDFAYRRAAREVQLRQSGIASMSDIYAVIYYVDLEKDELTPIHSDPLSESRRPKELGARDQLIGMIRRDADETYRKAVEEFIDLKTLPERLRRGSIACEYISLEHGWTRIRFFPADRVEGEPLKKVIFAIQDITDEKVTLQRFEERVERAEQEKQVRNIYLTGIAGRVRAWLQNIQDLDAQILAESPGEKVALCARQIRSIGRILSFTMDGGADASRLAAGHLKKEEEEYSAEDLIQAFEEIALTMTAGTDVAVQTDISPTIARRMKGDVKRLERVLIQLVSNAVHYTREGAIRLAVYGKSRDGRDHLLFSVKDTGGGLPKEDQAALEAFVKKLDERGPVGTVGNGHGLEVAASLLAFLGSRLEVLSTPGRGAEFYFEIEQTVVDSTPIGHLDQPKAAGGKE